MRVFHFVNEQFGIENIRLRRLKVATLKDLNDPFELLAIRSSDPTLRSSFRKLKAELHKNIGLLCFSRDWKNPVQWSHYADRHRGICLGFEIPDHLLSSVSYSGKRLAVEAEQLFKQGHVSEELKFQLLTTKYSHWRYESESRVFVELKEEDALNGLYFREFSEDLRLKQVIVGAESKISRTTIQDSLGSLSPHVQTTKARLAFKSFRVVHQREDQRWV